MSARDDTMYNPYGRLVSGEMLPVLDKLTQDDDSDVRYFSDEAIASVK